jgi:hypothetical protein
VTGARARYIGALPESQVIEVGDSASPVYYYYVDCTRSLSLSLSRRCQAAEYSASCWVSALCFQRFVHHEAQKELGCGSFKFSGFKFQWPASRKHTERCLVPEIRRRTRATR